MLSCHKNIKLFTLSILCCVVLLGCNTEKDSYKGPVQGSAQVAKTADTINTSKNKALKPVQASTLASNPTQFGEEQRFVSQSPDVTEAPLYKYSPAIDYEFGHLVVSGKLDYQNPGQPEQTDLSRVSIVPIQGWIRYPKTDPSNINKKFPIIVFLHGNHIGPDPSYQGYDYLATNLAEQGYVVLSIDANEINNSESLMGDASSQTRAQLVLGTLDKLAQLDEFGGAGALTALKGKLDFSRIGLMGHSRGGQGVNLAIKFNTTRYGNDISILKKAMVAYPEQFTKYPEFVAAAKLETDDALLTLTRDKNINFAKTTDSIKPYNFKAAITLGATDVERIKGITNVPTATLLPSCDGDMSDLQSAITFDNNRFSLQHDSAPKYQILVRGANHNFYNTVWTNDDFRVREADQDKPIYCNAHRSNTIRQTESEQRDMGRFLINSFLRYHVGDEQQFKAYWNATAQLPSTACAKGESSCDERAILTVQKQSNKLIQRFESNNAMSVNLLGGLNRFTGFNPDGMIACKSYLGLKDTDKQTKCSSNVVPFYTPLTPPYADNGGLVSFPDQLHLFWAQPNPSYQLDLTQLATQDFDSLTFRVAIPKEIGQEIVVELKDLEGKTARVNASDFSDALYMVPRKKQNGMPLQVVAEDEQYKGRPAEALNMISIPLKAFKGIKTNYLKELKFVFPKEKGSIAMNDIQLQKLRS